MIVSVMAKPKISVNELGKYLDTSDDLKRRSILKNQKEQNPSIGSYWNDAEKSITKFIAGNMKDEDILVSAIDRLHSTPSRSPVGETRKSYNITAIERFHGMYQRLPAFNMAFQKAPPKGWKIIVGGVEINIRPEIILTGSKDNGGIKLFFGGRTSGISTESMETVAALLHYGLGNNGMKVKQSSCLLVDVFNQSWQAAPATYKMRMRRLEATCTGIKLLWETI